LPAGPDSAGIFHLAKTSSARVSSSYFGWVIAALLKYARSWPEREHMPARDLLYLTILDSGQDLVISAGPEIFEHASGLAPMEPVLVSVAIERTLYHGNSAKLRAIKLESGDGDDREVAVDPDFDDSAKAGRKQLRDYSRRISP
jgi:hypothetical protein